MEDTKSLDNKRKRVEMTYLDLIIKTSFKALLSRMSENKEYSTSKWNRSPFFTDAKVMPSTILVHPFQLENVISLIYFIADILYLWYLRNGLGCWKWFFLKYMDYTWYLWHILTIYWTIVYKLSFCSYWSKRYIAPFGGLI